MATKVRILPERIRTVDKEKDASDDQTNPVALKGQVLIDGKVESEKAAHTERRGAEDYSCQSKNL